VTPLDCAVIFDVDGVLLDLTAAEEDVFFGAFAEWCPPGSLSRHWNTYRIRNDDNIVDEIMQTHGIASHYKPRIVKDYFAKLQLHLKAGTVHSTPLAGAVEMLAALGGRTCLGIATANFREAARLRLMTANLWEPVAALAFGADGGGHKHEVLARAIAACDLPKSRIVYIGDNTNDVEAGLKNGVHFIGFSTSTERRESLAAAGARQLSGNHQETLRLILHSLNA